MGTSPPAPEPVLVKSSQSPTWLRQCLSLPRTLAKGEPEKLRALVYGYEAGSDRALLTLCVVSLAIYGSTMGLWRGWEMALYSAIKLPLVALLVAFANGLLNGIVAAITGTGLGFRETQRAILLSFASLGVIAVSLAPLTALQALELFIGNQSDEQIRGAHQASLLTHTCLLALAGLAANLTLLRLLLVISATKLSAVFTLISWVSVNLLLGAQIGYSLRPFFGSASLEVKFLREKPLEGNFYESVWRSLVAAQERGSGALLLITLLSIGVLIAFGYFAMVTLRQKKILISPPPSTALDS